MTPGQTRGLSASREPNSEHWTRSPTKTQSGSSPTLETSSFAHSLGQVNQTPGLTSIEIQRDTMSHSVAALALQPGGGAVNPQGSIAEPILLAAGLSALSPAGLTPTIAPPIVCDEGGHCDHGMPISEEELRLAAERQLCVDGGGHYPVIVKTWEARDPIGVPVGVPTTKRDGGEDDRGVRVGTATLPGERVLVQRGLLKHWVNMPDDQHALMRVGTRYTDFSFGVSLMGEGYCSNCNAPLVGAIEEWTVIETASVPVYERYRLQQTFEGFPGRPGMLYIGDYDAPSTLDEMRRQGFRIKIDKSGK
jgi:hypothetical protein